MKRKQEAGLIGSYITPRHPKRRKPLCIKTSFFFRRLVGRAPPHCLPTPQGLPIQKQHGYKRAQQNPIHDNNMRPAIKNPNRVIPQTYCAPTPKNSHSHAFLEWLACKTNQGNNLGFSHPCMHTQYHLHDQKHHQCTSTYLSRP